MQKGAGATMRRLDRGLTYIELLVVVALMSILALAALPLVHNKYRRFKELELKRALATMRDAIDRFHDYAALGQIEPWDLDWNLYPKDLEMLVDGVDVRQSPDQPAIKLKFLRAIPVDPMTGEARWNCRGYRDEPDERSESCDDLYDVSSQSDEQALDGTYYRDW